MKQKSFSQIVAAVATLSGGLLRHEKRASGAAIQPSGGATFATRAMTAMAVMASLTLSAGAQTVAYTANVNTAYGGASTGNNLNMGQIFSVHGAGIEVFQLGFFDYQNHPLASSHAVTLFNNETPLASVTIPAGSVAPLLGSYAFEPLSTPIYLPAGLYTVLAYGVDQNDPYGEGSEGNVGFNGSANLTAVNTCYDFTADGSPDYPNGEDANTGWSVTWGDPSADASFTYTNVATLNTIWNGGGGDNKWSTSGNWNTAPGSVAGLTFAGSTRLGNTNDLSGFAANSITFDSSAGAFTLNGNAITLGGNIGFNGNPAAPVTQTVNLAMGWSASEIIDTPTNGNLNLAGNITSGADIIKIDAGTLTLGGTNAIESLDVNGGTNTIEGNTTLNGNGINNYDRFYVGDGDSYALCNGTLVIQPGAVFTVAGNFNDSGVIGRDGGSGTVIQNGGLFTFNPANQQYLWVGATGNAATRSTYNMNGGVFDLTGHTLGVGLGAGVLITGLVNQVSGVITNVGNLWLGGATANGYGVYNLSGGTIYIGSGGITTFSGLYGVNLGGGTVGAETSWSSPLNVNLTGLNGAVTFNPAGNTIALSGNLSGNGGLIVTGSGILDLSGTTSYTGPTTVSSGSTLELDATGSCPGAFHLASGSTLNLNFSGTYVVGGCYTSGVQLAVGIYNSGNLPGFITGPGSLQVASGVSTGLWTGGGANNNWSTAGNWNQSAVPVFPIGLTFAGTARLVNNNDLNGITANSITFDSAGGAFVLGGDSITLNGFLGFNGPPAAPVTQTINLGMTWNNTETIDTTTNGNLAFGGGITSSADTSLIKLDVGSLTLGGTNDLASWELDGGITAITGNTTINGDGNSKIYIGNGDYQRGCNGTLVIQPGATLTINGSFADSFVIGRDSGSGTVIQNGGTFTFDPDDGIYLFVGATSDAGTRSEYDMNGGLLDLAGNTLAVALGDQGVVNTGLVSQVNGLIKNVWNLQLGALRATGRGVYTLAGGSIYIGAAGITTVSGNYAINLGGGTVGAYQSWLSSLNMNLTNLNGSVTFDTAGNVITLAGTLSGVGGLTVIGSGTLELSGANTYTGDTTVSTGSTLQLDNTGSSVGAFRVAAGAILNLNYAGTYAVAGLYINGVALPVGVYNSGNLPGFIAGGGSLTVASSISTGLWTGGGANNNWSTAGNWNQNAVPIFPIGLTFAGTSRLENNNDLADITANSLTFDAAAGAFVLNGDAITLNGSIGFNGTPAASVSETINLGMMWNNSETIDSPTNGNLTFGGDITSYTDTSLIKLDTGTLTLGGTNEITSWDLDGGTTTITGNTTINGDGNSRVYVGDGDYLNGCAGTLVIQPGAVLTISGSFADNVVIGRDGGSGKLIQNGGTFTYSPGNSGYIFVGATSEQGTRAEYDMNGGLLDMNGNTLGLSLGDRGVMTTGIVSQVSGVIDNVGAMALGAVTASGYGVYTLTGGSIYVGAGGITTVSGRYAINLGGGTVGAYAGWTSSLNMNLTGVNGPVTFDTAGNTIALSGKLSGNGGLTVIGGGTLDLSGANNYTGDTAITAGTLELDTAGSSLGAFRLATGALLNLTYGGTYTVTALYTNNVALTAGVYTASNLPGFITGTGSLTVTGIPTTPTNVSFHVSGGKLTISWPGNYAGWILQSQTNTLQTGLGTNWVDVAGSANVTSNTITINPATPAAFYRLRSPTP